MQDTIRRFVRQPGLILAVINFCIGLVWIAVIPPLDAPDEPGHLDAIMQVRKKHILPEIHFVPTNTVGEKADPLGDPETRTYIAKLLPKLPVQDPHLLVPYESFQPPLYYLSAGLVSQLISPDPQIVLYAGRLVAVLFGAATVYFCWLVVRELVPQAPLWALASAGVVALLPEFCFTNAHAANDSAANLVAIAAFYIWIRGLRDSEFDRRLLGAGALLGLALVSKLTAIALIPGLALVILFRVFQVRPGALGFGSWLRRGLRMLAGATFGTALVCGWWFVRNVFTYGEPSGSAAASRFFAARWVKADFSNPCTAGDLSRYTLENLWGRFGWNDITLPHQVYHFCNSAALVLVCLTLLAGIGVFGLSVTRRRSVDVVAFQASLIFLSVALTLLVGFIQYNAKIAYQPQARYFFILLLPGALLLTGGLCAIAGRHAVRVAAVGILFVGLGLLNGLALVTVTKAGTATAGVRRTVDNNKLLNQLALLSSARF